MLSSLPRNALSTGLGAMEPSAKEAAGKAGTGAHITSQNVLLEETQTRLKTAALLHSENSHCSVILTLASSAAHWRSLL